MKNWYAVDITVAADAVGAAELALDLLDPLGIETDQLRKKDAPSLTVTGYFDGPQQIDLVRPQLLATLTDLGFSGEHLIAIAEREVADADWLAEWKRHWKPTEIGRFVVAPPWEQVAESDKVVITIEPNMAFGTGTHETTRLCLKAIGELYRPTQTFLDVGTGTGILAIAAAKLGGGKSTIVGFDTDLESVKIARENAAANGVADFIDFFDGPITDATPAADFICANLTIDIIEPLLPLLLSRSKEVLLLSGILVEQREQITDALDQSGIANFKVEILGEWLSVLTGG